MFIPADASISITYVESDAIRVAFLFPRRASKTSCEHSIRDAEKNVHLSKAEEDDR
jgi:hypothetical protein